MKIRSFVLLLACCSLGACHHRDSASGAAADKPLFRLLAPEQTHIGFTNQLTEGLNTNVLMYEYFYNGGGVAIGDLNGDGLPDIYFTGNMVDNKLYLNLGHLQFREITEESGAAGRSGPWKTGVTMADVDGDGKLDLFICHSGKLGPQKRINELLINQGNDANGIPHFKDMTAAYGLDFPSYSSQAYFFDYDRDGDLDLLLVNHSPQRMNLGDDTAVQRLMRQPDAEAGIRLLRNDGGHFTEVTRQAGIINTTLSYGLAAGIADVDGDGWPDIYISNDYNVPDRLYINNGKGGFTDELPHQMGHTSFSSMGNDVADINNDGRPDIFTLDMLPEDNHRQKLLFGADNYNSFDLNLRVGFYYQYMRNMLHLNNGNNTFSEIGQYAGISNTDWSWAPLFADYDNDGWKDLFISNGYVRDYTNMDFLKFMGDRLGNRPVMRQDLLDIVYQMPASQIKSYLFKNNGDGMFSNVSVPWGIRLPANSNGAAYADLDNDGDLDLVVNNINQPAFIYENTSSTGNPYHYLSIALKGADLNTQGVGAKVMLYAGRRQQYLEQMPTRGFQSSVSPVLHFGLGKDSVIDSLRVIWPRGKTQLLRDVSVDQLLVLREQEAGMPEAATHVITAVFKEITSLLPSPKASPPVNDFKRQRLLVNPLSSTAVCLAHGDVNGDGLEDVYVGGKRGTPGTLYLAQKNGGFSRIALPALEKDSLYDDAAALIFDANGDGKPDLYVASGGYGNLAPDDTLLQDRLYLNDGRGHFVRDRSALPAMLSSKSCVKTVDVNGDGHPDLFVGGRVVPGRYPETPQSYLLINDGHGHFLDETDRWNPALKRIGMVTDAAWVDMNGDHVPDLVVVGEWMPITVLENREGKLVDATEHYLGRSYVGWWNCLTVTDLNSDGHPDLIAGNLGLNSQCHASDSEPAALYYKDFDGDGNLDPILCFYIQHHSYPFVSRDDLIDQISVMRSRFPDYKSFSDATIEQVFTPEELKGARVLRADHLGTTLFLSDGTGKLHEAALPGEAQYAPVFTITPLDYDRDGKQDLLLCGNSNQARLRFGKYDANYGVLLKGDGRGNFTYVDQLHSGFELKGDVRSVLSMGKELFFGMDQGRIAAYRFTP
jgi:enediyne biosynthesis protein E4